MRRKPTIYVVEGGRPEEIYPKTGNFRIAIRDHKPKIEKVVLQKARKAWEEFAAAHPYAVNKKTLFYHSWDEAGDHAFFLPFAYHHAFGRSPEFDNFRPLADSRRLCALSSLCLVRSSDKKLIFGIKKDMDMKLTGFSGYACEEDVKGGKIDLAAYILRTISQELGLGKRDVRKILKIGKCYSPDIVAEDGTLNNRVFNNNFLIEINLTAEELSRGFAENEQFGKLIVCEDSLEAVNELVEESWTRISLHAVGALYNFLEREGQGDIFAARLPQPVLKSAQDKRREKDDVRDFLKRMSHFTWALFGNGTIAEYSIAPAMWQSFFDGCRLPIKHVTFGTNSKEEAIALADTMLNDPGFLGANIAMPWKSLFIEKCATMAPDAASVSTINTIIPAPSGLKGINTDGKGIVEGLAEISSLKGKRVLIIGAGGGAQTVPYHLFDHRAGDIFVIDIDEKKARALADKYPGILTHIKHSETGAIISEVDIIINASPCGMVGYPDRIPLDCRILENAKGEGIVAEMVYNPEETPIIGLLKSSGWQSRPGRVMLVEQAIKSFEELLGFPIKRAREVMSSCVIRELACR